MTSSHWYVLSRTGMATLCTDEDDARKSVPDFDYEWPHCAPHRAVQMVPADSDVTKMIRDQTLEEAAQVVERSLCEGSMGDRAFTIVDTTQAIRALKGKS